MNIGLEFHHVGIGTTDFDSAIRVYEAIGYTPATCVEDRGLGVKVAFLSHPRAASPWIEMLAPLGEESPLRSLIERGALPSPYHTCYAVHDLKTAHRALKHAGLIQISKAAPAVAFGGAPVAFFYNKSVGLIELVENPPPLPNGERGRNGAI